MRQSNHCRPFRPPDWGSPPPHCRPHHQQSHRQPQSAPRFAVILFRAGPNISTPTATEIDALVADLPSPPPDNLSVFSSGRDAARLLFRSLPAAAAAARELWSLRLEGLHLLTPYLPNAALAAHAFPLIASLFASHASRLVDTDLVSRSAARSAELAASIQSLEHRLRSRNSFRDFDQLHLQKKTLEAEKDLVDAKIAEYKASMSSIRRAMLHGTDEEEEVEEEGVDVFGIGEGKDVDFARLHMMMLRECRRLNEGLPIYAYRRKILNHIFNNQVMTLIGETGSGKSTQLVQFLADSGLAANGSIVCTQPRKIAATSLARRVDEESNGCYKDNFVLSYSTFLNSQDLNSKIIFCTDSCLLHHCMNDTGLDGISYIIVDEAHERSLNTDLLLALIKKKLLDRLDLHLIIMSATADADKLADYFYGCQTFHVKGRNFPVEINYVPDVSVEGSSNAVPNSMCDACATASYVNDVVRMVSIIHKNEEEGAVLAFLTSQLEVEWACENFSDASAVVLPMHGKLSHVEQSRVFKSYPGKRKIIFCTNMAETSLTIKEVKYVVDSGLAKESRFVPSSGLNVLKVNWISQSSANQRAGRAGRTGAGKCYRLYSEADFSMMDVHQEPEIRKVHLGTAVLRILALGVKDARKFEFVDAPNPEAISMAVKNLEQLGAVKHRLNCFELTDTGRYLVKLGIEPRLGKIMLDCFDVGLRKEGVVLAAVMANSSNIFCRVGTDEEKHKADLQKVRLCHRDGDLFTLLAVYKKWEDGHDNRNMWCWQNSINAKTMRRCQETISELENCLKHELNIIVPSYWRWNPEAPTVHDKDLKRIILSSLTGNLAMFLGHERFGYQVISTGQVVNLHPSSSLLNYGIKPEWVVFTEILSVPNQYLVCVTAVDHDALYTIHPVSFIKQLEEQKLQIKVISGLGTNLLRRFCGKYGQNQQKIISRLKEDCRDDRITVEINFQNNEVVLFATEQNMEKVFCTVNSALECEGKILRNECLERNLFPGRPGSSPIALFGSGAEIKHLELGGRYLTVEVLHQNAHDIDDKELIFLVDSIGSGIANFHKSTGSFRIASDGIKWGKFTFLKPENAEDAVSKLNGIEFNGSSLKLVPVCTFDNRGLPFPAVRAKLCWPRRHSSGRALITCASGEAEFVVNDCFALGIGGRYIKCRVSTKYENCVFAEGIPMHVTEPELYDAFRSTTARRILNIRLLRVKGNAIASPSVSTCEEELVREISPFMSNKSFPGQNFRVEVFPPEENDSLTRATITFDGSLHREAARALDHLEGHFLPCCQPWQIIQCNHVFHSTLSCPVRVYNVISQEVASLLESFQSQKGVSYNFEKTENGIFRLKLTANATKTIADLRRPLEILMKGKTINHPDLTLSAVQLLLSRDGVAHLKSIEQETGTYIMYDRQSLNIKVFGHQDQMAAAEVKLVHALRQLLEKKPLEIYLRGHNLPPDLMKKTVENFGVDLEGFNKEMPEIKVELHQHRHLLKVWGSKEDKRRVERMISELASFKHSSLVQLASENVGGKEDNQRVDYDEPSEDACPICLCEIEDPFRLESCGHMFCLACLVDQCESAMKSHDGFPICCLKTGCKEPLLVIDLKHLLSNEKLEDLFRASLRAFVASRAGMYRFCPTPDCQSIYQVAAPDAETKPFSCGACYVEICTKCHFEYHPFISCEAYKEYKEDPDSTLLEWRKGKANVKSCPSCGYTIEKSDGCNHVECRCGSHICWVCLENFRSSEECYGHLRLILWITEFFLVMLTGLDRIIGPFSLETMDDT
ncbi:ATP-dependent RNA helicase DEAH12, chloroplastic-like isoform X2 [Triticum urartu]|uniref:ATP-dependent RNA helicase DEAH12, chloroplastic-like isoform X2 n=1 Tax=Triticum urartu TaxID=4572 RepID=UPI002043E5CF|nr:ATP-dependent RNA helicase DEAH12, chloroplastic-like isoform X2 [Triticum urartu]XP_048555318.1 ATP-dependent RNA helicase DEAH12, chloroplastic-like isoform X2 [Triticum urartu]